MSTDPPDQDPFPADRPTVQLPPELEEALAAICLEGSPADRQAAIEELAGRHPQLAAAIRALAADLVAVTALLETASVAPAPGELREIGGHGVVRVLGEGAFGAVYLCRQEVPVVRNVAVKVLRAGWIDRRVLARFETERQLLAELSHPTITQVYDAGALADGRPYLVMEYVDGLPITAYCAARQLPLRQRLELCVQVCRGVAHANARGIVHRDLKPQNVLVVDGDEGPRPKIIDFGIAKALQRPVDAADLRTEHGGIVGTPGYMSPEQAAGDVERVDQRSDVFALGVMLYELLAHTLPWPRGAGRPDSDPTRPSLAATARQPAKRPTADLQRWSAALRGDLDWITLRALAREPEHRYASAVDLADDLERHLRGEPVRAGPPTLRRRLRRIVRRRRGPLAVLAGILIAVGGLAVALVLDTHRAADARVVVAAGLVEVHGLVDRLLERAVAAGRYGSVADDAVRVALGEEALALADGVLRIVPDDPELARDRCRVLLMLSRVHALLGDPSHAGDVAADAVALAERLVGADPENLAGRALLGRALQCEGQALLWRGEFEAARPLFEAAAAHLEGCASNAPELVVAHAAAVGGIGATVVHSAPARAIECFEQALTMLVGVEPTAEQLTFGENAPRIRISFTLQLARELLDSGELEAAEQRLAGAESMLAPLDQDGRLEMRGEWLRLRSRCAWNADDREAAVELLRQCCADIEAWRQRQPRRVNPHRSLITACSDLGVALNYMERFEESSAAYRRAVAACDELVAQFPDDLVARSILCQRLAQFAYQLRDRFRRVDLEEASIYARRATEESERLPEDVALRQPRWCYLATEACIDESLGGAGVAAAWSRVEAELATVGELGAEPARDLLLEATTGLARHRLGQGDRAAAAAWLARSRELIATGAPQFDKRMVEVGWLEARIAVDAGDPDEAAAAAERIVAARPTWFGRRRAADCLRIAWRAAAANGREVEATRWRDLAAEHYRAVRDELEPDATARPDDPYYVLPWGSSLLHLAGILAAEGENDQARAFLETALPRLEAVRDAAQVDQWDEDAFVAGSAMLASIRPIGR